MEIHDSFLLNSVIGFCDEIEKDERYVYYNKSDDNFLKHPLDRQIRKQLSALKAKLNKDDELPYETCKDVDLLWNFLIEKSIMCLRYFDKREPFADNGKEAFVYGLEDLNDYHTKYIEFEGVLYGSDSYYRDHVFHVIRVWLLGVFLLMSKNSKITNNSLPLIDIIHFEGEQICKIEKDLNEDVEIKELRKGAKVCNSDLNLKIIERDGIATLTGINCFSDELSIFEKISMWTIMSLCHDLGYPLEKSKKILEKTENMMEFFVNQPNIYGNIRFDGTHDSNNKDIILFTSKKMKAVNPEKGNEPMYLASIQEKYKFKYMLSLESFAHGIISSIIIYKMLIYFKETDNNSDANYKFKEEDARQFYIRRDILRAMASHTCQDIYHIDIATFPMLLFVCDELQEWGRKSWKDMYKGVANNSITLSIESFSTNEIRYNEVVDMLGAKEEQIIYNIVRVFKHQYLLYQTTFRDGQDTAKRKFDYIKHIEIKINNEEFVSIEKIVIDFEINHEKDNIFKLLIKDSGDEVKGKKKTEVEHLIGEISKALEVYVDNKKYGNVSIEDERKGGKK